MNIIIVLVYLLSTIVAYFFLGLYAPIGGAIIGLLIHGVILLNKIKNKLDILLIQLGKSDS